LKFVIEMGVDML